MQAQEDFLLDLRIRGTATAPASPIGEVPAPRDCAECGARIPQKRLRALPGTRLCVACQSAAEEGRA